MSSRKFKRSTDRKSRRIKSELVYFETLLKDIKSCYSEYECEWGHDFEKIKSLLSLDHDDSNKKVDFPDKKNDIGKIIQKDDKEEEIGEVSKDKHPPWAKKIFKQIAMITHPDKLRAEEIERLSPIFRDALNAINKRSYGKLVIIALDLGIAIDYSSPQMIDIIQSRILSVQKEIEGIKTNPAWIWCESFGHHEFRKEFIEKYFFTTGYTINLSDQEILEIIEELESDSNV